MDTDTTKVCLVYFSVKGSKIGLEGNKMNLQKEAFPKQGYIHVMTTYRKFRAQERPQPFV